MKSASPPENIEELLLRHGLRPTRVRRLILELMHRRPGHYSAEEMLARFEEEGTRVSVATLYQNLNRLATGGVLSRFVDREGICRYDSNVNPHHHLICTHCGRLADVFLAGEQLLDLLRPVALHGVDAWEISAGVVELQGQCPECRRRAAAGGG
ncbi:MAG: transcriptional repressor [Armatimonadetes bacterium]|nr:transcriptional repressor [Armatimonadota bacterium]